MNRNDIPTSYHHPRALLLLAALLIGSPAWAQKDQALRPEVGEPLQAAQQLIQSKSYKDALAKVDAAEQVGGLSEYERYIVLRMRAAAAAGSGNSALALSTYEQILQSPQLPAAEKPQTLEVAAQLAFRARDYGKAARLITDYQAAGGNKPAVLALLPQVQYLAGDYAKAQAAIRAGIAATEKAGGTPDKNQLQLLASAALKREDTPGYVEALQKLVTYYPEPDYWLDLVARTASLPGFSQRYELDLYRLRLLTGTLKQSGEYMEAVQLALQAGYPGEAQAMFAHGEKAGVLGTGPDAARHQRLKALIATKVAEDRKTLESGAAEAAKQASGDALVAMGVNHAGYGEYDKAIGLIRDGIAKGSLKNPEAAQLSLGYVQTVAGRKAEAVKTLKSVGDAGGAAAVARLWSLLASSRG